MDIGKLRKVPLTNAVKSAAENVGNTRGYNIDVSPILVKENTTVFHAVVTQYSRTFQGICQSARRCTFHGTLFADSHTAIFACAIMVFGPIVATVILGTRCE